MEITTEKLQSLFETHAKYVEFIKQSTTSSLTKISALEVLGHSFVHLSDNSFKISQPNNSNEIRLEWTEFRPSCKMPDRIFISLINNQHRAGFTKGNSSGGYNGSWDAAWGTSANRNIKQGIERYFQEFYERRRMLGIKTLSNPEKVGT